MDARTLSDLEILKRAVIKARENGWECGEYILEAIRKGREFNPIVAVEGLLCTEHFARAFWGNEFEKHLFGLTLVENPMHYLEMYV